MNRDEETFLSAYLDGELPPEQRDRVDSALVSDSALAEHLRELTVVRDLVAGLARPALQVDVASSVLARLENRTSFLSANSWGVRIAALTAAAATLLITTTIVVNRQLRLPGDFAPRPVVAVKPLDEAPIHALSRDRESQPPVPPIVAKASTPTAPAPVSGGAGELRKLLENPQLQKVFFVTDVLGGDADARIGEMIRNTPRRSPTFGRIVVNQGFVIDPAHGGEAIVFAVVMNENELLDFQKRLTLAFPKAVEQSEPRTELAVKLAEVGQISVYPGIPVADLKRQPTLLPEEASIALMQDPKSKAGAQKSMVHHEIFPGFDPLHDPFNAMAGQSNEVVVVPRDEPTREQNNSGPAPFANRVADAPPPDSIVGPSAPEAVTERARNRQAHPLVLVWVSLHADQGPMD
jgi:hypothetical protein